MKDITKFLPLILLGIIGFFLLRTKSMAGARPQMTGGGMSGQPSIGARVAGAAQNQPAPNWLDKIIKGLGSGGGGTGGGAGGGINTSIPLPRPAARDPLAPIKPADISQDRLISGIDTGAVSAEINNAVKMMDEMIANGSTYVPSGNSVDYTPGGPGETYGNDAWWNNDGVTMNGFPDLTPRDVFPNQSDYGYGTGEGYNANPNWWNNDVTSLEASFQSPLMSSDFSSYTNAYAADYGGRSVTGDSGSSFGGGAYGGSYDYQDTSQYIDYNIYG